MSNVAVTSPPKASLGPLLTTHTELFSEGLKELKPILPIHYEELSVHFKHKIDLDPDYPKYFMKELAGELIYVTLRRAGKLAGYFIGFIGPGLHYKSCMTLHLDIFYVVPEERGWDGGFKLMRHVQREFNKRGGKLWTMGVKEEHRFYMEKLLFDCGFEPFERHYAFWAGEL